LSLGSTTTLLLHHQIAGQGKPLFLLHGLFGSSDNLALIARDLGQHFRIISVDMRNHGHSFHSDDVSYQLMAEDILKLADHLAIEDFACLGHSMGGKVAMMLALIAPKRINKLIIADIAPVSYEPKHDNVIKGLEAVANAPAISSRSHAELILSEHIAISGVRQFLLKSLVKEGLPYHWRFNLEAIATNYLQIASWPDSQAQYSGPVRFLKGGDSDYLLASHQSAIAKHFPNASAKVLPGTGHWLHAEKPRLFNRLALDFLSNK